MALIYSQTWAPGVTAVAMRGNFYENSVRGYGGDPSDPLYPEVSSSEAVKVVLAGGAHGENVLDLDSSLGENYGLAGIAFQDIGPIAPGQFGATGAWNSALGRVKVRYYPNGTAWDTPLGAILFQLDVDYFNTLPFFLWMDTSVTPTYFKFSWANTYGGLLNTVTGTYAVTRATAVGAEWNLQAVFTQGAGTGWIKLYLNDVLIDTHTALNFHPMDQANFSAAYLGYYDLLGPVTNFEIYDDATLAVATPPIPPPTTLAPTTPCDPQTQTSDGGRGKAGCNTGGIGWVTELPGTPAGTGPFGDVPEYADPDDGETLTGKTAVDAWVEVVHPDYPSGVSTTYRRSFRDMADDESYHGGLKSEGLKALGDVEHGLGNAQGGFESATVDIEYADTVDRLFRTLLVDQEIDGDETRVKMATRARRQAGGSPRVLQRAVAQRTTLKKPLSATLTAVDQLFSDFGPFGPDKKFPSVKYPAGAWANMPPDVTEKVIPTLYGEKSDEGAKDPVTNAVNPKGLVPLQFVGQEDLGADSPTPVAWTEDASIGTIPTPLTVTNYANAGGDIKVPIYLWAAAVKSGQISVQPGSTTGALNPLGVTEPDGIAAAIHFNQVTDGAEYYILWASDDISFHPVTNPTAGNIGIATHDDVTHDGAFGFDYTAVIQHLNNAGVVKDGNWDVYVAHLAAGYAILNLYGSDLGGGVPTNKHDRTLIDTASRGGADVLGPDWPGWPFAERYRDVVGTDGLTVRLTVIYVRGPLSDDHKNGVCNMTVNAIGTEDIGDGTGLPIVEAEKVKQHVIENHLIPASGYRSGLWVTAATGPTWEDSTPKVRTSSFRTVQAYLTAQVGNVGHIYGWYEDRELDVIGTLIPEWNQSTDTVLGINGHGQIVDVVIDPNIDTADWPHITHVIDLFGDITRTSGEERENRVAGQCDWDPDAEKYRNPEVAFEDATAIAKYKGRRKSGDPLTSRMLVSQAHLDNTLARRLRRLKYGLTLVEITGTLGLLDYDVGGGIFLTTIEGTGETGYSDRPFMIMRRKLNIRSRKVTYTLLDLGTLIIASAQDFLLSNDGSSAALLTDDAAEALVLA